MAEETIVADATITDADTSVSKQEFETLKAELTKLENIKKEVIADRDKLKKQIKEREDKELEASGDLQKQLDAKTRELEEATSKLTVAEQEALEGRTIKQDTIKELIAQLPEEHREIADGMDISKLRLYVKIHSVKDPTKVDDGGGIITKVNLSEAEKLEAARMNLDEEQYFEIQQNRKKK